MDIFLWIFNKKFSEYKTIICQNFLILQKQSDIPNVLVGCGKCDNLAQFCQLPSG